MHILQLPKLKDFNVNLETLFTEAIWRNGPKYFKDIKELRANSTMGSFDYCNLSVKENERISAAITTWIREALWNATDPQYQVDTEQYFAHVLLLLPTHSTAWNLEKKYQMVVARIIPLELINPINDNLSMLFKVYYSEIGSVLDYDSNKMEFKPGDVVINYG